MIVTQSLRDYRGTVAALLGAFDSRGLTVFARIDHAAAAHESALELQGEEVFVFGNPLSGTPLMQSDPRIGIELPLRILIWERGEGVQIGYLDPRELTDRYEVAQHEPVLAQMATLLDGLAKEAAGNLRTG